MKEETFKLLVNRKSTKPKCFKDANMGLLGLPGNNKEKAED